MKRDDPPIRANGLGDIFQGRFAIIIVALVGLFLYWQANQRSLIHTLRFRQKESRKYSRSAYH